MWDKLHIIYEKFYLFIGLYTWEKIGLIDFKGQSELLSAIYRKDI